MTPDNGRITREDIEAKFRELNGGVTEEVTSARPQILSIGLAVAVTVVTIDYLAGRRRGRKKSAVVEIRRI